MCSFGRLVTHRSFIQSSRGGSSIVGFVGFGSVCWEGAGDGRHQRDEAPVPMRADLFGHPGLRALHEARTVNGGDGPGRSQDEGQRDEMACYGMGRRCERGRLPSPEWSGKGARDPIRRGDGDFRLCRGPARGPLGWAKALSPRVGRVGFPSFLSIAWG